MTLGSLFDGSGTFPLAATMCGITPVWASEIEPFPVQVTTKRFPSMAHLGDIREIDGARIPPTDIVTFGSPCQDLSVAGKRAGLAGEKSRLFLEAVRIIREMREATYGEYPKWIVWENVPGALSSSRGLDFRTVLEEISETEIPMPDGGKWANAGMVECPGGQFAWRVLSAQYFGVPQRRRRIFLVADFGGKRAGEVLFERKSLQGDSAPGGGSGQGTAAAAESRSAGSDSEVGSGITVAGFAGRQGAKAGSIAYSENTAPTQRASMGAPHILITYDARGNGGGSIANTLTGDHQNRITDYTALCVGGGSVAAVDCRNLCEVDNMSATLQAKTNGGYSLNYQNPVRIASLVRRFTPTECGRLQGFPDGWCDDVPHADTAEYKMWGNGMALPCVLYVMQGIKDCS